ncbi:MAG: hypothetical protein HC927_05650 [Deltaproteobacteria bacterium]|nr:hypothetical protein [Deltaproteobacteria bacterium]
MPRALPLAHSRILALSVLALACAGTACNDDTNPGDDEIGDATETSLSGDGDGDTNTETGTSDSSTDTMDTSSEDPDTSTEDPDTSSDDPDTSSDDPDTTTAEETDTTTGEPCGPECCPGEATCEGETSLICNEDGTAWEVDEVCDGIQGVVCNPNFGGCEGACSKDALGASYIGCDYYPTVTQQHDSYNGGQHQYAVAVANVSDEDAMITITRGANMVYDTVVPAGEVEVISLPWVDALTKTQGPSVMVVDGATACAAIGRSCLPIQPRWPRPRPTTPR